MRALYLSCYSDCRFRELIESNVIISQAAQKFNKLFVYGLCQNGVDVDVVKFQQESSAVYCGAEEEESCCGRTITYYNFAVNGNVLSRHIRKKSTAKQFVREWKKRNPDGIFVVDALQNGATEFSRYAHKEGVFVITVVTDFMEFLLFPQKSIAGKVRNYLINRRFIKQFKYSNAYVVLTEEMMKKLPKKNKAYFVVNGLVDSNANAYSPQENTETAKTVCLYSGAISKQFGLQNLVNGFIQANEDNAELHIYGSGDYVTDLTEVCKEHKNVKYFGTVANEEMVKLQRQATFLVNPRPIGEEYTKYSFPSKNLEYMVSGRPVVTTKLPCLTDDYLPYIYLFEEESAEGICTTLKQLFKLDKAELTRKGKDAQRFVIERLNNKKQAREIIDVVTNIKQNEEKR